MTPAACSYGLALTARGCVRTLASFCHGQYVAVQIVYLVMGVLALAASAYKYMRSVQADGAKLQRRSLFLCMFCSVTFLVRAIDPASYGNLVPRPITHFASHSCTAAIYTVLILSLCFWISIIHKGAAPTQQPRHLKLVQYGAILLIWLFKAVFSLVLFPSSGYARYLDKIETGVTSTLLIIITVLFAFYGMRVVKRLQTIDKMHEYQMSVDSHFETLRTARTDMPTTIHTTSLYTTSAHTTEFENPDDDESDGFQGIPVLGRKSIPSTMATVSTKKKRPARKIQEMLVITITFALICIIAQVVVVVTSSSESAEVDCARGKNCDKLHMSMPVLNIMQFLAIWCILFTFRRTKRRDAAGEYGLTRRGQSRRFGG
ncbi:hypothetical protein Poli38472_001428 [Pythium oligandrum]|uniref:THH1/TOM1/TOM3 domain-containing protein n=1 Tax=Pythium oligandrum TaxID=41045 RepID=A0A8K1FRR4_PYTOL|nr:hypothetical protein Poli38472_001428 [Pythium oligandrum]|eukprot:TMW69272.1 hypothetical protein Poli38472_001428 [Pythium oligandrum]